MSDQTNKPVLDEQTLGRLLEAAFVLQEHTRKMREMEESLESQSEQLRERDLANRTLLRESEPEPDESPRENVDYTLTLAEIVEAQHQIQIRRLELDKALAVVAERVTRITNASGAGIGILDEATVRYRAGAGPPALPVGTEVPLQIAVCQASVRTGQVIRTEDLDTEFLFDPEPCRKRGIRSLLAVPIYYDGQIAGALELYFARNHGFVEEDIHTCQLMAGLVTEALGRNAGSTSKNATAPDRSSMLAAREGLPPDLADIADDRSLPNARATMSATTVPAVTPCWKCAGKLLAEEQFCGTCGAPRAGEAEASTMQSKLASAWHTQQANEKSQHSNEKIREKTISSAPANGHSPRADYAKPSVPDHRGEKPSSPEEGAPEDLLESLALPGMRQRRPPRSAPSSSASEHQVALTGSLLFKPVEDEHRVEAFPGALIPSGEDFLRSLVAMRSPNALVRFWRSRRGDFYLTIAVVLVVVVIGWGIWSSRSTGAADGGVAISKSAKRAKKQAPDADLSTFDKFLIFLGVADPPETPEYRGNPDTQVWVDLNTALYYCPGSDLYAKTAKGKLTSQRDAQLDQFEPASRKACE